MGVSVNGGTPRSSILIGFSIINHPFWGTTIFGNTHMYSGYQRRSFIWESNRTFQKSTSILNGGSFWMMINPLLLKKVVRKPTYKRWWLEVGLPGRSIHETANIAPNRKRARKDTHQGGYTIYSPSKFTIKNKSTMDLRKNQPVPHSNRTTSMGFCW